MNSNGKMSSKRVKNLVGNQYGRLEVMCFIETKDKKSFWKCKCSCGNTIIVRADSLKSGHTKSCGCYQSDLAKSGKNKSHCLSNHPLYAVYHSMKARCYRKTCKDYPYYGGRGITICEEWLSDFNNFYKWAISNGYRKGLSIDRINMNGNYEPTNCRWETSKVQNRNTRQNRMIEINGMKKCLSEWCEFYNISRVTVKDRIKKGWSVIDAITLSIR